MNIWESVEVRDDINERSGVVEYFFEIDARNYAVKFILGLFFKRVVAAVFVLVYGDKGKGGMKLGIQIVISDDYNKAKAMLSRFSTYNLVHLLYTGCFGMM